MTQSTGNNFFDGSDIQRYHSGQMTAEERHALEKAALDDPFLADALEGYTYTTTANEDLVSIRSRLEQKTNRRKVVPLFTRTWMRVAAIIFFVAGGIWLLTKTQNASNNSIAIDQMNRKNVDNKASTNQLPVTDSVKDSQTFLEVEKSSEVVAGTVEEKFKDVKPDPQQLYSDLNSQAVDEKSSNDVAKPNNTQATPSNNSISSQRDNSNLNQRDKDVASGYTNNSRNRGLINSDMSRPTPEANVQNRLSNQQVQANRVRSWTESDSVPTGIIAQQRSQSDSVTRLNVVMTPQASEPLKEVVVSKSVAKNETYMKGRMAGIVIDTLEPAEGWTNFDDYIAGNLKVPDELKLKPVDRGEVELSFEINQKGEPVNITVVKSLCTKCDEEAKRLLKEGPKWKKKKNNKGKVTIRF